MIFFQKQTGDGKDAPLCRTPLETPTRPQTWYHTLAVCQADPTLFSFLERLSGYSARCPLKPELTVRSITCTTQTCNPSRCHSYNRSRAAQFRVSTDSCFIPPDVFNYFQNIQVWDLKKSMQRWCRGGPKG